MKKLSFLFAAVVIIAAFSACATKKTAEPYQFAGKTLSLIELNGESYDAANTKSRIELLFSLEDNRVSGNSACNVLMGGYTVSADSLVFDKVATSMMMCDPLSMDYEQKVLTALNGVNRYVAVGDTISFYDGESLLAKFVASVTNTGCCGGHMGEGHKCTGDEHGDGHGCAAGQAKCTHAGDTANCPSHATEISVQ